jgi:hypothetical protein
VTDIREVLGEAGLEDVLLADGFDDAAIVVVERCGQSAIVIYDYDKCIDVLVERDGMTPEEAMEYLDFNCVGAWVGEQTPGWLVLKLNQEKP